ncbi:MAG: L-threonylcarbamoyladenylate synthase [Bacteroidota bacterium]|nr:L-threonylcarbamoyladenylate synthase [Ferruginibacter sp.]
MNTYEEDIEQSVRVLHNGGLILYPTDTIWGIGCDATNGRAVDKIYRLKKRENSKSMIILVADDKDLLTYVGRPDIRVFDYMKGVSKPTTVIYDRATGVAKNLISDDGSIGIRIVKDPFCKELVSKFGRAIVSTSANISTYPAPSVFTDIDVAIKNGVDYIVQHRQDDLQMSQPSAIVRWNRNGIPTIIRK